jgi:hypothetical protein
MEVAGSSETLVHTLYNDVLYARGDSSEIAQFWVAITTNCRAVTHCVNVNVFFHFLMSVLLVLIVVLY